MEGINVSKSVSGEYLFEHEPGYRRLLSTFIPNGICHSRDDLALLINTLQLLSRKIEFIGDDKVSIQYLQDTGMKVHNIIREWESLFEKLNMDSLVQKMLEGKFDKRMENIFNPLWNFIVGYYEPKGKDECDLIYSKEMKFMYPYDITVTNDSGCKNYRYVTVYFQKCTEYEAALYERNSFISR